jgi:hypothetical protein
MNYRYAKFSDEGFFRGITTASSPTNSSDFNLIETGIADIDLLSSRLVEGEIIKGVGIEVIDNSLSSEAVKILAREKRDLLLQQSDWTQVPDSPVNTPLWATYRQYLRDVTTQQGFPESIVWPEKPK